MKSNPYVGSIWMKRISGRCPHFSAMTIKSAIRAVIALLAASSIAIVFMKTILRRFSGGTV